MSHNVHPSSSSHGFREQSQFIDTSDYRPKPVRIPKIDVEAERARLTSSRRSSGASRPVPPSRLAERLFPSESPPPITHSSPAEAVTPGRSAHPHPEGRQTVFPSAVDSSYASKAAIDRRGTGYQDVYREESAYEPSTRGSVSASGYEPSVGGSLYEPSYARSSSAAPSGYVPDRQPYPAAYDHQRSPPPRSVASHASHASHGNRSSSSQSAKNKKGTIEYTLRTLEKVALELQEQVKDTNDRLKQTEDTLSEVTKAIEKIATSMDSVADRTLREFAETVDTVRSETKALVDRSVNKLDWFYGRVEPGGSVVYDQDPRARDSVLTTSHVEENTWLLLIYSNPVVAVDPTDGVKYVWLMCKFIDEDLAVNQKYVRVATYDFSYRFVSNFCYVPAIEEVISVLSRLSTAEKTKPPVVPAPQGILKKVKPIPVRPASVQHQPQTRHVPSVTIDENPAAKNRHARPDAPYLQNIHAPHLQHIHAPPIITGEDEQEDEDNSEDSEDGEEEEENQEAESENADGKGGATGQIQASGIPERLLAPRFNLSQNSASIPAPVGQKIRIVQPK